MKKILMVAALAAMGAGAAPVVEITSVQQQYPWTNTVDITYTSTGIAEDNSYYVVFTALDSAGKEIGIITNDLKISQGSTWVAQWQPPFNVRYENCTMVPYVYKGGQDDYMIVDLETWKVTYEGMSLQKTSNAKYNTDTYKTTKLVLRKIEKGEYWIGHSQGSFNTWEVSYNTYHAVNMAKDYYIGVFPLTVAQYEKIMNNKTSSDMTMPHYSYATIRGTTGPGADPSSTCVLGKLTENTKAYLNGGNFDLPTISMWEVAARSGGLCKTHYLCGDTLTNMDKWAASSNSAIVGTCLANDWGFYDIHCNGFQLTRDMMNRGDLKDLQQDGQAPITSGTGLAAVVGSSSDYQDAAKISARSSNTFNYAAFIPRLAFIVP